jgi:hypothetical protein
VIETTVVDGAGLALRMVGLQQRIDRDLLEFSQLAAAYKKTDHWDLEGFNSALDWIRINCRLTSTSAADRIAVGERLAELGKSSEAMENGEIGFAHLTVMARTANAVGTAFDEEKLLPLAKEHSPGRFFYKSLQFRHAARPKEYAAEQAELVENRRLSLNTAEDGCLLISGILDPVGGAALRTALEPLARPSGAHDDRRPEKRNADALVELATAGGGGPPEGRAPGDELDRDLAWARRRARRRERVHAAHLLRHCPALGLRLLDHPDPDAGLGGDRRRPLGAGHQGAAAPGAHRPRPALPAAGLRPAGELVRRSPPHELA